MHLQYSTEKVSLHACLLGLLNFAGLISLFPTIVAGAVTQIQNVVCANAAFAGNPYCRSKSIWKGIMSSVLPPLLLTLWQNLCMPQLIYRGTQVFTQGLGVGHILRGAALSPSVA